VPVLREAFDEIGNPVLDPPVVEDVGGEPLEFVRCG
jgi:hypothetical protein